jgi:hypothetical protein
MDERGIKALIASDLAMYRDKWVPAAIAALQDPGRALVRGPWPCAECQEVWCHRTTCPINVERMEGEP